VCAAVIAGPVAIAAELDGYRTPAQRGAEISRDDARALDAIAASSRSGGVLTTAGLGAWVPAITGRGTWVGHDVWTPHFPTRAHDAAVLFSGRQDGSPASERRFVRSTGAAFVLEPCAAVARLDPALLTAGFTVKRIGCATLYTRG
jgi:hypothetical protein